MKLLLILVVTVLAVQATPVPNPGLVGDLLDKLPGKDILDKLKEPVHNVLDKITGLPAKGADDLKHAAEGIQDKIQDGIGKLGKIV